MFDFLESIDLSQPSTSLTPQAVFAVSDLIQPFLPETCRSIVYFITAIAAKATRGSVEVRAAPYG